jgi:hypothetical protein
MSGRTAAEQPTEGMPKFSDVSASHWAYADIMRAATTYPLSPPLAPTASPATLVVSRTR